MGAAFSALQYPSIQYLIACGGFTLTCDLPHETSIFITVVVIGNEFMVAIILDLSIIIFVIVVFIVIYYRRGK